MGNQINTKENEEAPYYNYKTKKLLYSSAGKVGMGGLDFYESEGDFAKWTAPRNLGYPFNSSKDDAYFTPVLRAAIDRPCACSPSSANKARRAIFSKKPLIYPSSGN